MSYSLATQTFLKIRPCKSNICKVFFISNTKTVLHSFDIW
jgi:hypothetical protein